MSNDDHSAIALLMLSVAGFTAVDGLAPLCACEGSSIDRQYTRYSIDGLVFLFERLDGWQSQSRARHHAVADLQPCLSASKTAPATTCPHRASRAGLSAGVARRAQQQHQHCPRMLNHILQAWVDWRGVSWDACTDLLRRVWSSPMRAASLVRPSRTTARIELIARQVI